MPWADYMAAVEHEERFWRDEQSIRGLIAMRLSPSLAVYRALLAGEAVPRDQLDAKWRGRYGL